MRTGSQTDIAAEQGVSRQRVHQWISSYRDFPPPISTGSNGAHYDLDAVKAWAQRHRVGIHRETA